VVLLLLISAGVAAYFLSRPPAPPPGPPSAPPSSGPAPPAPLQSPVSRQYNTINQVGQGGSNPGGVLVHMFDLNDARDFLNYHKHNFDFSANDALITDCSPGQGLGKDTPDRPFKGTCSAWTYMRKDLLPITLNNPQTVTPSPTTVSPANLCVGVIVDPAKVWQYISTMSPTDSDTNHRSNGENYYPAPVLAMFNCFKDQPKQTSNSLTMAGRARAAGCDSKGHNCPSVDCDPTKLDAVAYEVCRSGNSGGGVNFSNYGCPLWDQKCKDGIPAESKDPSLRGNWGCADCTMRGDYDPALAPEECKIALMPNRCVVGPTPQEGGWQNYWSYQTIERIPGQPDSSNFLRAANYVDPKSFYRLATDANEDKAAGLNDPVQLSLTECKFQRDDWEAWLGAIKQVYRAWRDNYDAEGRTLQTKWGQLAGPTGPAYNYLMGCNSWIYLENEVNLYFRPFSDATQPPPYKAQQDKDLQDAVLGFFYVEDTCLQLLGDLDGVTCTTMADGAGKYETRTSAHDRCAAFACGYLDDKTQTKADCIDSYVDNEDKDIACRYNVAKQFVDRFNATYRTNGTPVQLYKYKGASSVYYRRADLDKLFNGVGVPGEDVFQPVTSPPNYPPCPTSLKTTAPLSAAASMGAAPQAPRNTWRAAQAQARAAALASFSN